MVHWLFLIDYGIVYLNIGITITLDIILFFRKVKNDKEIIIIITEVIKKAKNRLLNFLNQRDLNKRMIKSNNKRCKDCERIPSFGYVGDKIEYCFKHKKERMINLTYNKCKECNRFALYGFQGGKKEYCNEHKEERMLLLLNIKTL